MSYIQNIKRYFRSAFREFFVYHNSSLEFRAKLFAIVAGANEVISDKEEKIIKDAAIKIYNKDEDRASTLWLATKEYVQKIQSDNDLGVDELAKDITHLLKRNRRFVSKIDINILKPLMEIQEDQDTKDYQKHILDFLQDLKVEFTPKVDPQEEVLSSRV